MIIIINPSILLILKNRMTLEYPNEKMIFQDHEDFLIFLKNRKNQKYQSIILIFLIILSLNIFLSYYHSISSYEKIFIRSFGKASESKISEKFGPGGTTKNLHDFDWRISPSLL